MLVRRFVIFLVLLLSALPSQSRAETPLGSTISEEVFLYLKVSSEAAQSLLPEGWTLAPWTKGAWAGANLLIILGETHSDLNPEGKPRRDTGYLNMRLFTWGRNEAVKWRIFNAGRFATDDLTPSSTTRVSMVNMRRSVSRVTESRGHAAVTDHWEIDAESGTLRLEMSYSGLAPRYSTQQGKVVDPDAPEGDPVGFRIKQISYMIQGLNHPNSVSSVDLENSIPDLLPLLDGNEEILAIRILPVKFTERLGP